MHFDIQKWNLASAAVNSLHLVAAIQQWQHRQPQKIKLEVANILALSVFLFPVSSSVVVVSAIATQLFSKPQFIGTTVQSWCLFAMQTLNDCTLTIDQCKKQVTGERLFQANQQTWTVPSFKHVFSKTAVNWQFDWPYDLFVQFHAMPANGFCHFISLVHFESLFQQWQVMLKCTQGNWSRTGVRTRLFHHGGQRTWQNWKLNNVDTVMPQNFHSDLNTSCLFWISWTVPC